ncbi:DNA polymerase epsilon noncatalytic subunit [Yamadazyma tenuis]|uniref:DNA polymerase epsilon subunit D n=1 Tax=Candida tenuis (strain ATCC 10573 / BCRC 21748 / CBS 615 / JCM 9827 / NBRC 10315 / NRRL Y-1498 / VKM Y-70) TaxID=590646 RepID=G3AZ45_CANTC|nr:uncharacterized protein CANTEDRAFT_101610 [Yamadazyma tenuis ATCC 10573]EGV66006.1 hypothetical protein CANTEDRAFT_101610 [Yamadazyma tenuis ATCC 10573]WEJ95655.1 DNA polymerase epsilon noncatalytic subunit [Yamadazyma tenuis]
MPPKGWRKNPDGSYPQPNREAEITSIDEILFPRSIIQRLAKDILNSNDANMSMAKDSLIALQRSATVFVSHVMFHARAISKASDRKTVNAQDILAALEAAEYSGFVPEIKHKLASFEAAVEVRKSEKAASRTEPADFNDVKRLKDNSENAVPVMDTTLEDDDHSDNGIEDNDNDNTEEVNDTNADEEDEIEEVSVPNPIAGVSQEATELEGVSMEEPEEENQQEEED